MKSESRSEYWRTSIVPITLTSVQNRAAHAAAHSVAGVWNHAVDWVRGEWDSGNYQVSVYDCKKYLYTLPNEVRPVHSHSTAAVAFELFDAIKTYRENKKQNVRGVHAPWRHKNYRPITFTRNFGWRVNRDGRLMLSFGRGRSPVTLPVPVVTDPLSGESISAVLWGEIQLCWDRDARRWSLHVAVPTVSPVMLDPSRVVAIDEGIINSMTLAARQVDGSFDVAVINGREARSVKRLRNKSVGQLQRKLSRTQDGSRRHRKLRLAKKKVQARSNAQLRDFNHQVARKAANFAQAHDTGRIVVGDVRGIEQRTRQRRKKNPSTRQQLSQWERGTQEQLLAHKTGVKLTHIDESYSSQTCPACLARNRPSGRRYRCRVCTFICHRDAVGAINIWLKASFGMYVPIDPNTQIRVTYLRAVRRFVPTYKTRGSALNRAAISEAGCDAVNPGVSSAAEYCSVAHKGVAA